MILYGSNNEIGAGSTSSVTQRLPASARQGLKGSGFHSDALPLNHIFNTK
jgi:hypothetical protein